MNGYNLRDKNEMTIEKELVSWNNIEIFISKLENWMSNLSNFTGVYGPPRGGVVFASIISNRYGLPYLGAPQVGCLIVDDIVDSGNTAQVWKDKGYTIASMYFNKKSIVEPDFWLYEKTDKWICFPWECKHNISKVEQAIDCLSDAICDAYPINNCSAFIEDYNRCNEALDILQEGGIEYE